MAQFERATRRSVAVAVMSLAGSQTLYAAGFALIEQSVPNMGTAYAGAAATADSPDTLYFNPAGMTRLPGTRAAAAVHLIKPKTEFDNDGTSYVTGAPIQGGNGGDAGGLPVAEPASDQIRDTDQSLRLAPDLAGADARDLVFGGQEPTFEVPGRDHFSCPFCRPAGKG